MKVKCINNINQFNSLVSITIGKIYDVEVNEYGDYHHVNDDGQAAISPSEWFTIVDRKLKLERIVKC